MVNLTRSLQPCFLAGLLCLLPLLGWSDTPLHAKEEVIFFNTNAYYSQHDQRWHIPIHGWIYEHEDTAFWHKLTNKGISKLFGLDDDTNLSGNTVFRQRARMFFVDSHLHSKLHLKAAGHRWQLHDSTANGHFQTELTLLPEQLATVTTQQWLPIHLDTPANSQQQFYGQVQLIAPTGISVISDIDDTIKISNVLDRHELMQNTFVRSFSAVPAMSILYQQWQNQGAVFHYVSASPWQLYPALTEFLTENKFPAGSLHLKQFRLQDESCQNLFLSPYDYKLPILTELFQQYPQREFILVGDSGEKDPEVYATMLQRFPKQVKHIYIRNVTQESHQHPRYQKLFAQLDVSRLTVFDDARLLHGATLHTVKQE